MSIGITLFLLGLGGLAGFSGLLLWESRRTTRVFSEIRARCDRATLHIYRTLVFGEIPHVYRQNLIIQTRRAIHRAVNWLIVLLRTVEKPLARMSSRMRYSQDVRPGDRRPPSPFLKDMSNRKEGPGQNPEV